MNKLFEAVDNLYESGKALLNEWGINFDAEEFENKIPHNMRWKYWDFITNYDSYGRNTGKDILYWVTQEDFSVEDLEKFVKALSGTGIQFVAITVRDYSDGDYRMDLDSDVLCSLDLTNANIGLVYQEWYDRINGSDEVSEASEDEFVDVVTDPYDLGFTEEDLKDNLRLEFTSYDEMSKSEHEDFPECDAILCFDVYYDDFKVGETQCYGAKEDKPEEYFDQVLEDIIGNPIGMDFSEVKHTSEFQKLKEGRFTANVDRAKAVGDRKKKYSSEDFPEADPYSDDYETLDDFYFSREGGSGTSYFSKEELLSALSKARDYFSNNDSTSMNDWQAICSIMSYIDRHF